MRARPERLFSNRYGRFALMGGLGGLLVLIVVLIYRGQRSDTLVLEIDEAADPNTIRVYVGGAVARPGLYSLPRGSRVADAIDAAGGPAEDADTSPLGMAAILADADQIIVPFEPAVPTSPVVAAAPTEVAATVTAPVADSDQRINVNTASAADLEALPGIGPALAERIIQYREANGPFQTVDELEAVRGISAAMVEELRPFVTVGT